VVLEELAISHVAPRDVDGLLAAWSIIFQSEAFAFAADVRKPALRLCPENRL